MILIENTMNTGWEAAIWGARNALQSRSQIDSGYFDEDGDFVMGEKDHALLFRLAKAGPDHGKFMRMIHVSCDITAPVYFLRELDTYKVGTTCNSTSLQHTGAKRDFTLEDFSLEQLDAVIDEVLPEFGEFALNARDNFKEALSDYLTMINDLRRKYEETDNYTFFLAMRQLIPMSYNYMITWDASYAVLRNIYHQRKNHRLPEWRQFCEWIKELPYSEFITVEA